ncbi:transcription factor bHLH80 isoform X2 [Quercus lobata]|uniref:BHLH domain-containing protein n=1 Tax=Quercus lobata TaxID=97700 RepID=A0A7N2QYS3_QUELO|nr:transcription factor bHLH80 isoform X2 [Quercus lobata]
MQPTPGGRSSSGGGGSGELSGGGGLARFRSAPATWLEALLEEEKPVDQKEEKEEEEEEEEEEDEEDPLKPTQSLTQLLASSADPSLLVFDSNIFRQNSSPAEFFGNSDSETYFSNFGLNPNPPNYNNYDSHSNSNTFHGGGGGGTATKRSRELNHRFTAKFPSHHQLKGEQSSGGGGVGSFIDMEMEKLLEDSVPCRVRAKRGCATHPRSIAERVRRTRISDRIRKLQELVPNMDKQTNTADMLEEAVEYVKLLQKQIQANE